MNLARIKSLLNSSSFAVFLMISGMAIIVGGEMWAINAHIHATESSTINNPK